MDGQSRSAAQTAAVALRQTAVWKEIKVMSSFQTMWFISDLSLMIAVTFTILTEGMGWLVPTVWVSSALVARIAHQLRQPLQANERLLAGILGVMAAVLFGMGQKLVECVTCTVLLGLSAVWAMSGSAQEHLASLCHAFGDDEQELLLCRRELAKGTAVSGVTLTVCMMLLLHYRLMVTVRLISLCSALFLVFAAVNDPMDRKCIRKLQLLQRMEQEGRDTAELRKWLNAMLAEKHRRAWAILLVQWIIRHCYRHRVAGLELLEQDELNPVIYMCNHGSMYGPVVGYIFTPTDVRPWTISNVMTDLDETVEYLYRYTFSHVRWIPKRLRRPITVLVARLGHWGFRALESVPVYRDHPMKLMQTFRCGIAAMQCGDDMLIFP